MADAAVAARVSFLKEAVRKRLGGRRRSRSRRSRRSRMRKTERRFRRWSRWGEVGGGVNQMTMESKMLLLVIMTVTTTEKHNK